ncbi:MULTISPECIES: hypothetical protein [Methylobacterium]|uniref:hypothetical protein n=1 Tax=Methylobacterium TaxID=407 RepID=UPI0013ED760B|nr:hypothetical protein [Methylobacterium sp. DB0501]NGM33888.1 hypothetical protein [Methylobacterium sp. DB0501]
MIGGNGLPLNTAALIGSAAATGKAVLAAATPAAAATAIGLGTADNVAHQNIRANGFLEFPYGGSIRVNAFAGPISEGGDGTWANGTSFFAKTGFANGQDTAWLYVPGGMRATPLITMQAGSGRVGIGNLTPGATLDVVSSQNNSWSILTQSAPNGANASGFYTQSDLSVQMALRSGDGSKLSVITSSGLSYLMGGNVGIGTNAPQVRLDVAGDFKCSGVGTIGGASRSGEFTLDGISGLPKIYRASTNGSPRWAWGSGNGADSGEADGSDFFLNSYGNDGSYRATPFRILRSTGAITITNGLTISGTTTLNNGLVVAGKIRAGSYTVSTVPAGVVGELIYVSNARKVGESAGAGTGVISYYSNGNWRRLSDDSAIAA